MFNVPPTARQVWLVDLIVLCKLASFSKLLDETSPTCQRCQQGGLECDGPKDTTFVESAIVKSRRTQRSTRRRGPVPPPDDRYLIHDLQPRMNECEVYICYTQKHLRPDGPIDLGIQDFQPKDFTLEGDSGSRNSPVFKEALASFATLYFGAQHKQSNILTRGYSVYSTALQQLNRALADPVLCLRDETILSVITLAMLELFVPSGPGNYLKHIRGAERLVELQDPAKLMKCSRRSQDLYKGVQHMILFASLRTRSPSILARPDWKRMLRTDCSDKELEEQDLYDVLADCSVLIAANDAIIAKGGVDDRELGKQQAEMKGRAHTLLADLSAWKMRWDSDEDNAHHEVPDDLADQYDTQAFGVSGPSPMASIFRFKIDSAARLLMLYNTTLMFVLEILAALTPEVPITDTDIELIQNASLGHANLEFDIDTQIAFQNYAVGKRLASLDVARCITDYLDPKWMRLEPQFASPVVQWAFTTVGTALGGNKTVEGKWVMALLERAGSQAIAKGAWEC